MACFEITYNDPNRGNDAYPCTWNVRGQYASHDDAMAAARKFRKMNARMDRTVRVVSIVAVD